MDRAEYLTRAEQALTNAEKALTDPARTGTVGLSATNRDQAQAWVSVSDRWIGMWIETKPASPGRVK